MIKAVGLWVISLMMLGVGVVVEIIYYQPVAVVVPHHNVVKERRLEWLKEVKNNRLVTNTVIVISPDHFSADQGSITDTDTSWNLHNGVLETSKKIYSKLAEMGIKSDVGKVKNDHGIFNVLTDVKTVWGKAEVATILIGQRVKAEKVNELVDVLTTVCGWDCLLIASVDFSHYLPRALADIHDEMSIRTLENMELNNAMKIEVDSPQSILMMMEFSMDKHASYWQFGGQTNLGWMDNNRDEETTSHVFGWYDRKRGVKQRNNKVTFLVTKGLDAKRDGKLLGERFFYGTDINMVDIEMPDNIAKAGVVDGEHGWLLYLPMKDENGSKVLLRGEEKTRVFNNLGVGNEGIVTWYGE